jgi:hypothetical protein
VSPDPAPTAPSAPSVPTNHVVDALSGAGLPNITVLLDDGTELITAPDGGFDFASTEAAGLHGVTISGSGAVIRQTHLRVPASNLSLNVFPASLDLTAFDQMIRGSAGRLQRWLTAPPLVLVTSTLTLSDVNQNSYTATADQMSSAEADRIVADLQFALPQLSGNHFSDFSSISRETPASGSLVNVSRTGQIVAARYTGLRTKTGFVGYGRWAWDSSGDIVAGIIFYDLDYDRSNPSTLRALHAHELGHALGYNHVTARTSVMNPTPIVDPVAFDRDATTLAFLRTPGNTTPDNDVSSYSTNAVGHGVTWSEPVP